MGHGDHWRPAAPDTPADAYDHASSGSRWRDVRRDMLAAVLSRGIVVEGAGTDGLGGITLLLSGGMRLEVFPDQSNAPHDEVEFWRLFEPGSSSEHFVLSSNGIDHVAEA